MSGFAEIAPQRRARWRVERARHFANREQLRSEIEQLATDIEQNATADERAEIDFEMRQVDEQEARLLNMEISDLIAMRRRLRRILDEKWADQRRARERFGRRSPPTGGDEQ